MACFRRRGGAPTGLSHKKSSYWVYPSYSLYFITINSPVGLAGLPTASLPCRERTVSARTRERSVIKQNKLDKKRTCRDFQPEIAKYGAKYANPISSDACGAVKARVRGRHRRRSGGLNNPHESCRLHAEEETSDLVRRARSLVIIIASTRMNPEQNDASDGRYDCS